MTALVAYATRHGSTAGIADRIAEGLTSAGVPAESRSVEDVRDVATYDAFVVGGAVYMYHWLKQATTFVKSHSAVLAERPVWLFSSGPLGNDLVDAEGRDIFDTTRPREFVELRELVHARGERVFFGAYDPQAPAMGLGERVLRLMPASRSHLRAGDFRDWLAIDEWAADIAAELLPRTEP